LIIGQPVNFQFFGSTVRRDDLAGTHLEYLEAIAADNGQKWHVEFDVRDDASLAE